jgi:hypothetical protein
MGTLASELSPHVDRAAGAPRVYVDANMPARVVAAMRHQLKWDVYFVMEHEDLRRADDGAHFRLSRQMRRTLVTLDRDYLDDRRYPARESGGVLVLSAPREDGLIKILRRVDRDLLRPTTAADSLDGLPLEGRKLHLHPDWAMKAPSRPDEQS